MKKITSLTKTAGVALALAVSANTAHAQKFEGLAPTPPMGWNSWNTFEVDINEDLFKEMVDLIVDSGMKDAGYEYVVVDDGWEAMERDAHGNLVPDPEKFPSGMKALADYVHSKGLKFGIHNCAGTKTCNGLPGGRGHEFQDARLYASWGVDYLKYDWCSHGTADAKETYSTMRDALYAAGRPVVYSLCEWGNNEPWKWAEDVGHLWRTTGDVTDCYTCQGEYDLGWKFIMDLQVGLEKYAGPDHWNDPDMLEVGNPGLTFTESRSHFSIWCMLAAPLMAGNDLRVMSPEILDILTNREAIAVDQDPLGKQGYLFMDHPTKNIWVKELSDGDYAICFLNTGDKPYTQRVNWKHYAFLDLETGYDVYDIWADEVIGATDENYEWEIAPRDVRFLRLRKR
ncbi:glycoside hydrolase family 27 protein [Pelagicoccus sp. SDUM812003]|uniref:glycoside hydrolase family 27 protein n=1 Tax=Pelagicoccus sp. SDUM812003 TaxID=3041267 RepID=UPI00280D5D6A|nr:glycoside hydrolase family 27 protein [Pelagicoccus sp. SDUM812003]MDQ8202178.1 glycoside hydrolase family 27 protein [Pelagicoccus sp. SDUM812003]